jgi:nitrite reductase (NADH) large subunit
VLWRKYWLVKRRSRPLRITIFGAEPRVNYNRIMLSPVLAGEKTFDDIVINGPEWYTDNGITLVSGDPVVGIDRADKVVVGEVRPGRAMTGC